MGHGLLGDSRLRSLCQVTPALIVRTTCACYNRERPPGRQFARRGLCSFIIQAELARTWRAAFCHLDENTFQQMRSSCAKSAWSGCVPADPVQSFGCVPAGPGQSSGNPRNASTQPDIAAGCPRSSLTSWSYGRAMHSGNVCAIPGYEKRARDGGHVPGKRQYRQWPGGRFPASCRLCRRNRAAVEVPDTAGLAGAALWTPSWAKKLGEEAEAEDGARHSKAKGRPRSRTPG